MKHNQITRDSYFISVRRSTPRLGRDDQKYAPMDEYTLLNEEENASAPVAAKGLQEKVEELLYLHPEFDDRHLHVSAVDGKVTLMGRVPTLLDKNLAESLVMELDGVVRVINLLEVDAQEPWMNSSDGQNLSKGLF